MRLAARTGAWSGNSRRVPVLIGDGSAGIAIPISDGFGQKLTFEATFNFTSGAIGGYWRYVVYNAQIYGSVGSPFLKIGIIDGQWHNIRLTSTGIFVDGEKRLETVDADCDQYMLGIMCAMANNHGSTHIIGNKCIGFLTGAKIWYGDVLAHDLIPHVKGTTAGLLNKVNNEFFGPYNGVGSFSYGELDVSSNAPSQLKSGGV